MCSISSGRAAWWWSLRERFESGDIDIDPHDDELAAQIGAIKYGYTSRGQVIIESKADARKRGLPSPDRGDALMLTATATPPTADEVVEDDEHDDYSISAY